MLHLCCAGGSCEHVIQPYQGILARHRPMAAPWFVDEPLQSFLHKPLYPLIGMATAQANSGSSIGDRHPVSQEGVPVVFEQKTTILWKCLYLLASLKDFSGFGGAYEANRRGGEENPVHGRNTTVNVDKIRGFRPPYVWTKPFVFLHSSTVHQQCVVFCALTTGTPTRPPRTTQVALRSMGNA
jgi:hypothetical protein